MSCAYNVAPKNLKHPIHPLHDCNRWWFGSTPRRIRRPSYARSPMLGRTRGAATSTLPAQPYNDYTIPSPQAREAMAEMELRSDSSTFIYGIPRTEWLALNSPARYLGNEFGAVHKPWDTAEVRFAMTYPEIYEVGASNLGHIILYGLLNQEVGVLCDRAYMPADDMKELLQRYDKRLFGVESRRPLRDFDALGFSLAYELGGTNILDMLHMSGIGLTWEERKAAEPNGVAFDPASGSAPLVFAGGPTATSNPEPFADFFDFFALGDGEELLVEVARCLKECKALGLSRDATLFRLATTVPGVYVPQFYDAPNGWGGAVFPIREGVPPRVRRRVCAPDPFQQVGLVPYVDTIHNRLTVEIRRGCTRGCRFCQPGMLTRPARDVDPDRVVDAVEHGMRITGYNEFSLLSLSCSDYLSLPAVGIEIKNRLGAKNNAVSLSLPSQRVDRFDDDIANIISNSGKRSGLTFAPEAGTQRLRDIINKGLTNDELLRGIKTAWERGWRQVKLYFMIGLPGETDEDVLGIAETVEWLQRECRDGRWHLAVNVTISNFSPKPHTPFQWHSVSTSEFLRKQAMLKEAFSKLYQVKANFTPVKISAMEDFVARGDRRLGAVIKRAWELGATNDGWWQSEELAHAAWTRAIDEVGMSWKYRQVDQGEWDVMQHVGDERYRGYGGKGRVDRGALADARLDAPLPWDHIDTGISRWWLKTDLQRALEAATVPDCSHSGLCSECGVCGDEFGDNVVFPPPPVPEFTGHQRPDSTRAQRLRFRYSKTKEMMFIGHLDLMTTWDRAARRAALPVTSDGSPFNARQRIYTALPLPLGATASSEILEIYLTEKCDPHAIRDRLQAQLPPGLELWKEVEDVPITKLDGSLVEKVSVLVDSIEWYATVSSSESSSGLNDLGTAVSSLLSAKVLHLDRDALAKKKGSKSRKGPKGRRKQGDEGNVRPALLELEVVNSTSGSDTNTAVIRFKSAMQYGNPALSPAAVVALLEKEMGMSMSILRMHRSSVSMRPPSQPKVDVLRLRSLARMEGHLAVRRQFGLGAWSGGLESREQQPSS